jgi:FtsZ-binding cell division protein ZapB
MKINKLNKVFIVLIAISFITIGFLSYYTQELKTDNNKLRTENSSLKFSNTILDRIIDDLIESETISDNLFYWTNKLSNKIQRENIELKEELEELKE